MKNLKFLVVFAVVLGIGIGNVQAKKAVKEVTTTQMVKSLKKDLILSFKEENIGLFVENDKKTTVTVTLRVCKDCCIQVMEVEGGSERIQKLVKETINTKKYKADEICKYRKFRVPLTFVYHEH
ncbi:hypothetical protein [Labilibacter marinus]|uniref:hypothetical protein n=1 Tax=Labilibacter marinus TaxID=1477105 RepID=UPI0009501F58|nr:hypothetical protein [Labilibacter marinus]